MIKTLRITSFLAAILAITFFVTLVVYGVHKDENIEKYLNSPDVIAQFKTAKGSLAKTNDNQISPLVQQAQAFSSILNPPKPKETARNRSAGRSKPNVSAEPNVKPKFTVKGTSYFESNPELSMVLIDEPGKGTHWVKQSTMVGHLLIEDVKDGIVVVKSSEETYELKIEEKLTTNTSSRPSSVPNRSTPTRQNRTTTSSPTRRPVLNPTPRQGRRTTTPVDIPQPTTINTDRSAELEALVEKLQELKNQPDSDRIDSGQSYEQKAALIENLINNIRNSNTNINEKEAENLDVLGDMLEDMREKPN
jgi:hypothetical protein